MQMQMQGKEDWAKARGDIVLVIDHTVEWRAVDPSLSFYVNLLTSRIAAYSQANCI